MTTRLAPNLLAEHIAPLMQSARFGCQTALGELIELLYPHLRRVAQHYFSNAHPSYDVADVVQDALTQMTVGLKTLRDPRPQALLGWLRQIVRHRILNAVRHERIALLKLHQASFYAEALPFGLCELASPLAKLLAQEEKQSLETSLSKLAPEHSQVLYWRHIDGLTYKQIGFIMRCSERNARRIWANAITRLRKEMGILA